SSGDTNLDLKVRSDFIPELWSVSGTVTGPLQLLDDSRSTSVDLKGKIAVELEEHVTSDDPEFPTNATEGRKLQDAGAIAAIIIQSSLAGSSGRIANEMENFRDDLPVRLTPMAGVDVPDYPGIPVVIVSADAGRQLLAGLRKAQNVTAVLRVDVERKIH